MLEDGFFYCAPCRLKTLVVPLGKVRAPYFSQCIQLLRANTTLSYSHLEDERLPNALFNPSSFPQGQLRFDFITHWDAQLSYLEDFQKWRKLYAIIAVHDRANPLTEQAREQELEIIGSKYKATIVRRVLSPLPEDSKVRSDRLHSFLIDLGVELLLKISDMAHAIQCLPTVRSPLDQSTSSSSSSSTVMESFEELKRPASVGPGSLPRTSSPSSIKHVNRSSVVASQNASSENLTEKGGTSKGRGRVLKVVADLSLLCGTLPNAVMLYTQSIEILRLTTDYVWHASALEGIGIAIVLLTYLKLDYPMPSVLQFHVVINTNHSDPGRASIKADSQAANDDSVPAKPLVDTLLETHTQILNLYQRSLTYSSAEPVPAICYTDNILRMARLLSDIYFNSGLDDVVLKVSVHGGEVEKKSGNSTYPSRGEIARWAMRAWDASLGHDTIPISHRAHIICALVHIMGTIGFRRKRAALLSELLHLFVPQLVHARVVGASEWGLHPNVAQGLVNYRSIDDDGLVDLMKSLTKPYGATIPSDDRPLYGWPSLRAQVLKECVAFCEALPHPGGVVHFTSLLFAIAADHLDKDEQIRLAGNLPRIVVSSRKIGHVIEAEYWDIFLIRNIEIIRSVESELRVTSPAHQRVNDVAASPFLYSARSEVTTPEKKIISLVQNEEIVVQIVLRNSLDFDLDVSSFRLWTEGVAIEMAPSSFVLPAQSLHTHSTLFKPVGSGELSIKGCTIKFSTCTPRQFPILCERSRRDREVWYDMCGGESKVKKSGIGFPAADAPDAMTQSISSKFDESSFWIEKTVTAYVLPPQPVLTLESSLLGDGCMMLLEGETKTINLKGCNMSDSPVNHFRVGFYDSTSPVLEEALSSTLLAEDEAAELEFFLYDRPAFLWLRNPSASNVIPPYTTTDLLIQINGKRGLTHGSINVEYGSGDRSLPTPTLYRRQVQTDLVVTVNASVDMVTCDVLPLSETSLHCSPSQSAPHCQFLLILEMRNSWINPLEVSLSVSNPEVSQRTIQQLLQFGQTRRIVITLPRILLDPAKAEAPLSRKNSHRQFIVSTLAEKDTVYTTRETWWYRQELLNTISGMWAEHGVGARRGDVELRGIRLNDRHVRIVSRGHVEAMATWEPWDDTIHGSISRRLNIIIKNHQGPLSSHRRSADSVDSALTCYVRLVVMMTEGEDKDIESICCDGLERSHALTVPPGQCTSWWTDITLLACGHFGIGAVIEECSKRRRHESRRWWTSNLCCIDIPECLPLCT